MKVALFSRNLHRGDAIGQQTLAKWSYFQKQSSEVRLYLSEASDITSAWVGTARQLWQDAAEQQFLLQADLILAEFGAAYDLLHLLPAIRLAADGVHRPVIVVEYHGVTPRELAEAEAQAELLQAEAQRCYLWSADGILVHSSFAARELNRETGIPLERIHTIPCWVAPPFEITEQRAKRTSAKVDLRTPPQSIAADSRIILFVGRFTRNKQPALLVEALRLSQHRNWQLVFIGSQDDIYRSYREACQQQVARAGLQERVHFLGKVRESELAHWYRLADCIALPSRHECFGMPMVEAMQYGKPVLYGDAGALPEVVGHAGLQCSTHSAQAWTSAWHRLFEPVSVAETRKVAIVTHRYGQQFAGGAEKSLRTMGQALQNQGWQVEVFTTCNTHESQWSNTLPAGTLCEEGITVHRFPVDPYDAVRLGKAYQTINERRGTVTADVESQYLANSLGSQPLIRALQERKQEFQAILTGPYLFKLVYEVAQRFSDRVLLAPCFHEEPLARLTAFQRVYRQVAGMLFHSEAEARLAARELGISHPRHAILGTVLPAIALQQASPRKLDSSEGEYLVYCGRYCPEKGLDRLVQYLDVVNQQRTTPIRLVCMGQGPYRLPSRPWLVDRGFVSEEQKRDILAGAFALIHLSRNESLSIVALEAWAQCVPVIADASCAVLKEQVLRSKAGASIQNPAELQEILDYWKTHPEERQRLGALGRAFVEANYASPEQYALSLQGLVNSMLLPLHVISSQVALRQAQTFSERAWQERFRETLLRIREARKGSASTQVELSAVPQVVPVPRESTSTTFGVEIKTVEQLIPHRGPGAATLRITGTQATWQVPLAEPLVPRKTCWQTVALEVDNLHSPTRYQLELVALGATLAQGEVILEPGELERAPGITGQPPSLRQLLADLKQCEKLPEDYLDVTEGAFAGVKAAIKRKLLHNFRQAYVDVAFRQQSQWNEKVVSALVMLAQNLHKSDYAVRLHELEQRVRKLEKLLRRERQRRLIQKRQILESAESTRRHPPREGKEL